MTVELYQQFPVEEKTLAFRSTSTSPSLRHPNQLCRLQRATNIAGGCTSVRTGAPGFNPPVRSPCVSCSDGRTAAKAGLDLRICRRTRRRRLVFGLAIPSAED